MHRSQPALRRGGRVRSQRGVHGVDPGVEAKVARVQNRALLLLPFPVAPRAPDLEKSNRGTGAVICINESHRRAATSAHRGGGERQRHSNVEGDDAKPLRRDREVEAHQRGGGGSAPNLRVPLRTLSENFVRQATVVVGVEVREEELVRIRDGPRRTRCFIIVRRVVVAVVAVIKCLRWARRRRRGRLCWRRETRCRGEEMRLARAQRRVVVAVRKRVDEEGGAFNALLHRAGVWVLLPATEHSAATAAAAASTTLHTFLFAFFLARVRSGCFHHRKCVRGRFIRAHHHRKRALARFAARTKRCTWSWRSNVIRARCTHHRCKRAGARFAPCARGSRKRSWCSCTRSWRSNVMVIFRVIEAFIDVQLALEEREVSEQRTAQLARNARRREENAVHSL